MRYFFILLIGLTWGCKQGVNHTVMADDTIIAPYQAIGLLGDTLRSKPTSAALELKLEEKIFPRG